MGAGLLLFWLAINLSVMAGIFGKIPGQTALRNIQNHNSSEVYASGGELLGKFFIYDRTSIGLKEINPQIVNALIATEDVRFYQHDGTDARSMARVMVKNILLGDRSAGGGSTITRQLVKNLFPRQYTGLFGLIVEKIKEGIIARRLEKVYTKDEVLALYLNTVPFGENVFGIWTASQRYFNKHPRLLAPHEAAVLVGMLKATHSYNPRLNPDNALSRRNVVLGQMKKYGYLPPEQADSLSQLPLTLDYNPISHLHGPAPYFREMLRTTLVKWLDEYNQEHQTSYNLYTDGLKIHTTLDFDLQLMAEQALQEEMSRLQKILDYHYRNVRASAVRPLLTREMERSPRYHSLVREGHSPDEIQQNFQTPVAMKLFHWQEETTTELAPLDSILKAQTLLHAGLLSLEPASGAVKAWIGGNNFRYFQYDNVLSGRQAGSAFKPFVYAAALERGIDPCEFLSNEAFVLEDYDQWSPGNYNDEYEGYYSMKGALAHSINTVSTRYLMMTGFDQVIDLAHQAGISSSLPAVPSLGLGSGEVSMLELTAAYAIFANQGIAVAPWYLMKIEDADGQVLLEAPPTPATKRVISEETALLMTDLLSSVVNEGTAASLRSSFRLGYDIAGKTGTTSNNADGWFVGYTPGLITTVWTGLQNPVFAAAYPLPLGASGTALPLWGNYMAKAGRDPHTRNFVGGNFPALPEHLAQMLDCPLFLDELPQPSWLERIFGSPRQEQKPQDISPKKNPSTPKKKSRLRRLLEEIL
ncbi:MAG: transglycosylase domain-containing protein [Bacteroidales bacterium]